MKQPSYIRLIILASLAIVAISTMHIGINGTDEDAVRLLIRGTARASAILFAIAFGVSSFYYLFKNRWSGTVLKYRAHVGLAFGVFHTFHLFFLIWLQQVIHPVFTLAKTSSLIGGGLAYVFMYLMMITTFPSIKAKISLKSWKYLHLIGSYWIWLIFFRSYFKQVLTRDKGYVLLGIFILVIILRVLYLISKRKRGHRDKVS